VIIAGHIDLSVGSIVAATGAIAAKLMVDQHMPWPLALVLVLLFGALIGAWQGYWVAYFGIPAFIVTLAGMLLFRAVTLTILGNRGIGPMPETVRTLSNGFMDGYLGNIGLGVLGGADLFSLIFIAKIVVASVVLMFVIVQLARFRNLPWVLVLLAGLVLGYSVLANRSVFGRQIYAVGGNLQAATLSGVKVKSVIFWIFVNMGVLSALAGVIFAGRLNQANPTAGQSFELDAIAAAFIGGAAVQGGVGKVVGAITGGLIMGVINNGMNLIGAPSEQVMLVKGAVLLAAVAFDVWTKRRAGAAR
jgi:putative multiple sugar transport system permease protein